jgi:hypothetical protein
VETRSSEDEQYYLSVVRGLGWLREKRFEESALQEAGQVVDNELPMEHYMTLDSEGRRKLKEHDDAH